MGTPMALTDQTGQVT
nr:hypothetical protein [Delftia sp. HK171]